MNKATALTLYTLILGELTATCYLVPAFSLLWKVIFSVCFALTLVGLYLAKLKFTKIYKALVALLIFEVTIMAIYVALFYSGLLSNFTSIESTRDWFASFGVWSWVIFFLIQVAQVVILPIPAQFTTIAGVLIFGGWTAFLISAIAVILGSIIAFALGRSLGVKVAIKVSSKETVDKYRNLLTKKGILLLPIMFIFPLFPDDLLCFIAGTTNMSWLYFLIVTLLTRTFGIGCICLFGSGDIIPFSGWGIPVWIVLGILLLLVAFILLKHQDKITNWIINVFGKKTKIDEINDKMANFEGKKSNSNNNDDFVNETKIDDKQEKKENNKTENLKILTKQSVALDNENGKDFIIETEKKDIYDKKDNLKK